MFFNSSIDRTELILFILTAILAAFNFNNPKIDIITQPTGGGAADFRLKSMGDCCKRWDINLNIFLIYYYLRYHYN